MSAKNKDKTATDFSKGSVSGTIFRLALPLTLAQMVNVLYSIVDRVYLGHIPEVGALALTGVGVTFPIITIINGFTNLCGFGGSPLFSICRGQGSDERASKVLGNAAFMLTCLSAILLAIVLVFKSSLLYVLGASSETFSYANDYISIYILGIFFQMLGTGLTAYINNQGFAGIGMMTTVLGAVANIILDPIFIFDSFTFCGVTITGLNMGVKGAALATIIAQFISALWSVSFLIFRAPIRLKLKNMLPDFKIILNIAKLGFSTLIMSFTTCATQIMYNSSLQTYGGDIYVATMTVTNSIREVIFMGLHGMVAGAQPVVSFNYGARDYKRTLSGMRVITYFGVIYTGICSAIVLLFPNLIITVFNDEPALLEVAPRLIRVFFSAQVAMSFHIAAQYINISLGKSKPATFFSIFRKIIVCIPMIIILPKIFSSDPTLGVFLAEPVADVLAGICAFGYMYVTVWRKMRKDVI